MADAVTPWPMQVNLRSVPRDPLRTRLQPDEATLKVLARQLGLVSIKSLQADVALGPWEDGAELTGWLKAEVVQTCSVTAEPLDSTVDAGFSVRMVPPGSPRAPTETLEEIEIDAMSEDPPDVLESDVIDVSHYVVEHLVLELDPFPRKPGAVFEAPEEPVSLSPFAALAKLRDPPPEKG